MALFVADMSSAAVQTRGHGSHGYIWPWQHFRSLDIHPAALTVDNSTSFIVHAPHVPCVAVLVPDMFAAAVQTCGHSSCSYIWP